MSTATLPSFNPLQFAKRLKDAGVPEKQAEAEAEVLREAFDARDMAFSALENKVNTQKMLSEKEAEQMATKGDVFAVREEVFAVKADITKLDAKIDLVRKDFESLRWIVGAVLGGVVAILVRSFF